MLDLGASGRGVNLETSVFVGKSLKAAVVFVGDSNLKDRKHNTCNQKEGQSSTADQSEPLSVLF